MNRLALACWYFYCAAFTYSLFVLAPLVTGFGWWWLPTIAAAFGIWVLGTIPLLAIYFWMGRA